MQLPIGLENFILNKALETIKDTSLINKTNNYIKNKDYTSLTCKLKKALYSLK